MAMEAILNDKTLKIVLDAGTVDGKQVMKRISFPVKFAAADEDIHVTAQALVSLTDYSIIQVLKDEESIIREV